MPRAIGHYGHLTGFKLALSAEGLSPVTIGNYVNDAVRFLRGLDRPLEDVRSSDVRAFPVGYGEGRPSEMVCALQISVWRFFRIFVEEGDVESGVDLV